MELSLIGRLLRFDAPTIHMQEQSPLYSSLPAELRTYIFELALTAHDNIAKPYHPKDMFYRPGYHYQHHITSLNLLRTCQRVYLDTCTVPFKSNEFVFWGHRGPTHYIKSGKTLDLQSFYTTLKPFQSDSVKCLHIFFQQYALESQDWSAIRPSCKKLKITLRHQDWWYWEWKQRLWINPDCLTATAQKNLRFIRQNIRPADWQKRERWGRELKHVRGLEEFEMEFETTISKKEELLGIVELAKDWEFEVEDERMSLQWTGRMNEYRWEGSMNLSETPITVVHIPHRIVEARRLRATESSAPTPEHPQSERLPPKLQKYVIFTMTWRLKERRAQEAAATTAGPGS